jgi:signal transduction histidine kinase
MPTHVTLSEGRLKEAFEQSRALVRHAHERCEQAAKRSRLMREWIRRTHNDKTPAEPAASSVLRLALEENERAGRERERFIAVVSHELRQPLNAAVAALGVLETSDNDEAHARAQTIIGRQIRLMIRLMDDLLDMSRLSVRSIQLQPTRTELADIVEAAIETVEASATDRDIRIVWPPGPPRAMVVGDCARLQQVFGNLLSNAVRYTPRGGEIRVGLCVQPPWALLTVADNGRGIDPSELNNIFEPFARGGNSGSEGFGIGLALVKGLVELHGGSVIASSPGKNLGATFEVRLPLA